MKDLYKHLSDRLAAVSELRWIDFNLGQIDQEAPPVSWPCALIQFVSAGYINLGQGVQQAQVIIEITLAFKVRERTHSKAEESYRDEALSHLDTVDAAHAALSGTFGENFGPLTRQSFASLPRADYRVYTLTYSTLYTDVPQSKYVSWDSDENGDLDFCITKTIE